MDEGGDTTIDIALHQYANLVRSHHAYMISTVYNVPMMINTSSLINNNEIESPRHAGGGGSTNGGFLSAPLPSSASTTPTGSSAITLNRGKSLRIGNLLRFGSSSRKMSTVSNATSTSSHSSSGEGIPSSIPSSQTPLPMIIEAESKKRDPMKEQAYASWIVALAHEDQEGAAVPRMLTFLTKLSIDVASTTPEHESAKPRKKRDDEYMSNAAAADDDDDDDDLMGSAINALDTNIPADDSALFHLLRTIRQILSSSSKKSLQQLAKIHNHGVCQLAFDRLSMSCAPAVRNEATHILALLSDTHLREIVHLFTTLGVNGIKKSDDQRAFVPYQRAISHLHFGISTPDQAQVTLNYFSALATLMARVERGVLRQEICTTIPVVLRRIMYAKDPTTGKTTRDNWFSFVQSGAATEFTTSFSKIFEIVSKTWYRKAKHALFSALMLVKCVTLMDRKENPDTADVYRTIVVTQHVLPILVSKTSRVQGLRLCRELLDGEISTVASWQRDTQQLLSCVFNLDSKQAPAHQSFTQEILDDMTAMLSGCLRNALQWTLQNWIITILRLDPSTSAYVSIAGQGSHPVATIFKGCALKACREHYMHAIASPSSAASGVIPAGDNVFDSLQTILAPLVLPLMNPGVVTISAGISSSSVAQQPPSQKGNLTLTASDILLLKSGLPCFPGIVRPGSMQETGSFVGLLVDYLCHEDRQLSQLAAQSLQEYVAYSGYVAAKRAQQQPQSDETKSDQPRGIPVALEETIQVLSPILRLCLDRLIGAKINAKNAQLMRGIDAMLQPVVHSTGITIDILLGHELLKESMTKLNAAILLFLSNGDEQVRAAAWKLAALTENLPAHDPALASDTFMGLLSLANKNENSDAADASDTSPYLGKHDAWDQSLSKVLLGTDIDTSRHFLSSLQMAMEISIGKLKERLTLVAEQLSDELVVSEWWNACRLICEASRESRSKELLELFAILKSNIAIMPEWMFEGTINALYQMHTSCVVVIAGAFDEYLQSMVKSDPSKELLQKTLSSSRWIEVCCALLRESGIYHISPPVAASEESLPPPPIQLHPTLKSTFSIVLESWIQSGIGKVREDLRPMVSMKFFDYLEALRKGSLPLPQGDQEFDKKILYMLVGVAGNGKGRPISDSNDDMNALATFVELYPPQSGETLFTCTGIAQQLALRDPDAAGEFLFLILSRIPEAADVLPDFIEKAVGDNLSPEATFALAYSVHKWFLDIGRYRSIKSLPLSPASSSTNIKSAASASDNDSNDSNSGSKRSDSRKEHLLANIISMCIARSIEFDDGFIMLQDIGEAYKCHPHRPMVFGANTNLLHKIVDECRLIAENLHSVKAETIIESASLMARVCSRRFHTALMAGIQPWISRCNRKTIEDQLVNLWDLCFFSFRAQCPLDQIFAVWTKFFSNVLHTQGYDNSAGLSTSLTSMKESIILFLISKRIDEVTISTTVGRSSPILLCAWDAFLQASRSTDDALNVLRILVECIRKYDDNQATVDVGSIHSDDNDHPTLNTVTIQSENANPIKINNNIDLQSAKKSQNIESVVAEFATRTLLFVNDASERLQKSDDEFATMFAYLLHNACVLLDNSNIFSQGLRSTLFVLLDNSMQSTSSSSSNTSASGARALTPQSLDADEEEYLLQKQNLTLRFMVDTFSSKHPVIASKWCLIALKWSVNTRKPVIAALSASVCIDLLIQTRDCSKFLKTKHNANVLGRFGWAIRSAVEARVSSAAQEYLPFQMTTRRRGFSLSEDPSGVPVGGGTSGVGISAQLFSDGMLAPQFLWSIGKLASPQKSNPKQQSNLELIETDYLFIAGLAACTIWISELQAASCEMIIDLLSEKSSLDAETKQKCRDEVHRILLASTGMGDGKRLWPLLISSFQHESVPEMMQVLSDERNDDPFVRVAHMVVQGISDLRNGKKHESADDIIQFCTSLVTVTASDPPPNFQMISSPLSDTGSSVRTSASTTPMEGEMHTLCFICATEICHSFFVWSNADWRIASLNFLDLLLSSPLASLVLKKDKVLVLDILADVMTIRMNSASMAEQNAANSVLTSVLRSPDGMQLRLPGDQLKIIEPLPVEKLRLFMLEGYNETVYAMSSLSSSLGLRRRSMRRSGSSSPPPPSVSAPPLLSVSSIHKLDDSGLQNNDNEGYSEDVRHANSSERLISELMGLVSSVQTSSPSASGTAPIIAKTTSHGSNSVKFAGDEDSDLNDLMTLVGSASRSVSPKLSSGGHEEIEFAGEGGDRSHLSEHGGEPDNGERNAAKNDAVVNVPPSESDVGNNERN